MSEDVCNVPTAPRVFDAFKGRVLALSRAISAVLDFGTRSSLRLRTSHPRVLGTISSCRKNSTTFRRLRVLLRTPSTALALNGRPRFSKHHAASWLPSDRFKP